jgi:type I restriction enzyme S subunit
MDSIYPKRLLGDLVEILTDGTHRSPKTNSGPYLYITSKNVKYGHLDLSNVSYIAADEHKPIFQRCPVKKGDLLLTKDGASTGNAAINTLDKPFSLLSSVALIRGKKGILNNNYLLQHILSARGQHLLKSEIEGQAITRLTLRKISKFPVPLPSYQEQIKISRFLSTWDTVIEKIERLIAAKEERYRWLLLEMINKGCEKNEWEKVRLGKIFAEVTRKVGNKKLTPFSISAGIGFVSQKEKWGRDIAGAQLKNYIHLKNGEFAYNKGNSKKYACGCAYLLKDKSEICVPNVFICFKANDATTHSEFFEHYFIADNHARELRKYISSSARSDGLLNLSKIDFFKIKVPHPPVETQKRIAEILSTARREINLHKKQLAALQKQKRGLMQKLLTGQWRVKVKGD